MKTLKSIILGLALLLVCGAVNANPVNDNENLTATHAVNTYIDAITRGKLNGLNDVLDQHVKFNMLRGKKMLSFDKKEMMDFFKGDKNVEQDCVTSTDIVESNTDIKVVKVDMKYKGFTRSNYVTVANTGDGWKITNVYSVFK
ncbi:nuclear transport factor 2 family protein [Mucilaginibacter pedocola]|uniref:DUF4440 domain-containing protein n=1 Tax=Mucilaginibacter pedocola TaxID=1792845 RepID=A0A1S9PHM6_9SPHI|nr:nuclear transport factor 2 family protein [Mucilaginibacter pedocola]OOQ60068.1 hypothetical protein BC343_27455 [Mucilaginibacter pedocola]